MYIVQLVAAIRGIVEALSTSRLAFMYYTTAPGENSLYAPVYNHIHFIFGLELFRFGWGCVEPGADPLDDSGLLPPSQAEAAAQGAHRVRLCARRLQSCTLQILSLVKSWLGGESRYSVLTYNSLLIWLISCLISVTSLVLFNYYWKKKVKFLSYYYVCSELQSSALFL